ncbi:MAG: hypothetical protein CL946_13620 [Ectothiorhodospiraceae bacterium]|nr:hypothetical protein [Ectothiorhodospiraceae bacterium]
MQRSSFTACAFILASLLFTCARAQELPFSVGADIRLTTSSQVFPTPFSIDPFQRNATDDLGSFASAAVHARHGIIDLLQVQLSFEYIQNTNTTFDNYDTPTEDGFTVYASELSGIFTLPFSSKTIRMYAGGGVGAYYGQRDYNIAGIASEPTDRDLSFGIHVLFGLQWMLTERLGVRAEFLFRDPQMTVYNRFNQRTAAANGVEYTFPQEQFPSKINLNGNVYLLGIEWMLR